MTTLRRPQTTIADVAALAEVSVGTASKALNGRGQLRPETRERVLAAAQAPRLLPQRAGARPARGTQLHGRTDHYRQLRPVHDSRSCSGVEDALGAGQISVFMCDGRDDVIREQHYIRTLLARRVDGIVITGRRADPRPPIAADLPVPVVYAMTQSTNPEDCSVAPDDEGGGRLAAQHLVAVGRTRIGHITGPERFLAARLRAKGAQAALADAGLTLAGPGPLHGDWSEEWGRQAAHILLRADAGRRRDLLWFRSDRPRHGRRAARERPADTGGHRPGRVRQLGAPRHRLPATAHDRRREPEPAGPVRRRAAARGDRRPAGARAAPRTQPTGRAPVDRSAGAVRGGVSLRAGMKIHMADGPRSTQRWYEMDVNPAVRPPASGYSPSVAHAVCLCRVFPGHDGRGDHDRSERQERPAT